MLTAPQPGQIFIKMVEGREYHYCAKHRAWGGHTTVRCEGKGLPNNGGGYVHGLAGHGSSVAHARTRNPQLARLAASYAEIGADIRGIVANEDSSDE